MTRQRWFKSLTAAGGLAVAAYGGYALRSWLKFGRRRLASHSEEDPLLDQFIPVYDVVERHTASVAAPAEVTFAAACDLDMTSSVLARSILRSREFLLGAKHGSNELLPGLVPATMAIGWGVLAEVPGREIVMGAVTQPWLADVVFRPIASADFATFHDDGFVKIVWTLRAEPVTATTSIFRTETRALACGKTARSKFRMYWATLSPGIILIRKAMLGPLKRNAERQFLATGRLASQS